MRARVRAADEAWEEEEEEEEEEGAGRSKTLCGLCIHGDLDVLESGHVVVVVVVVAIGLVPVSFGSFRTHGLMIVPITTV